MWKKGNSVGQSNLHLSSLMVKKNFLPTLDAAGFSSILPVVSPFGTRAHATGLGDNAKDGAFDAGTAIDPLMQHSFYHHQFAFDGQKQTK
jgi:hypothetical protein